MPFSRPSGTRAFIGDQVPSVETLGYSHLPLRGRACGDGFFGQFRKQHIYFQCHAAEFRGHHTYFRCHAGGKFVG